MSTVKVLEEIKQFLNKQVTEKIKLRCPDDTNTTEYSLINPNIFVGWVPPKGYLPESILSPVPCIVVGLDDAEDDSAEAVYRIRLTAVVYSQLYSPYQAKIGAEKVYTNFDGYVELLNLLDTMKAKIKNKMLINNYVMVDSPVKWGMYLEQPMPYWYGYMTFSVRNKAYPAKDFEKLLNNM